MITSLSGLRRQSSSRWFYDFEAGDPRGLERLSLEQQKKRARELLRALQQNDADAIRRLKLNHPKAPAHREARLTDAQRVIARELGFNKWTELKAHIEQAQVARDAVESGAPASLDNDALTLHIRCGNDIQHALVVAGFVGDFLCFADPYVQGPVPQTESEDAFVQARARFLESTTDLPFEKVYEGLQGDYHALDSARDYPRVCIWLEHDPYDQLILAKLLDYFSHPARRPPRLRLISVTHFPGVRRFNGIGQLPPDALRLLWTQFADVSAAQLDVGQQAWAAVRSPTPQALQALIDSGTLALPTLARALHRFSQEYPSAFNGLGLTEQLSLQILYDKGAMNAARLFGWYTNHYEPLPFFGDSQYWSVLGRLAGEPQPAIKLDRQGDQPRDWKVELTDTGRALLEGQVDWLSLHEPQHWIGGAELSSPQARGWRYHTGDGLLRAAGDRKA